MDKLNRSTVDVETERLLEKLQRVEPGSKEYHDIRIELTEMVKLANEDDKLANELEVAKAKIDSESEKMALEEKRRWWQIVKDICVPIAVPAIGYFIVYKMNLKLQENTQQFEIDGHSYTSKFNQFQVKAPNPRL